VDFFKLQTRYALFVIHVGVVCLNLDTSRHRAIASLEACIPVWARVAIGETLIGPNKKGVIPVTDSLRGRVGR
jgi:hypothetical protein